MSGTLVRPAVGSDLPSITDLYNHYVRTSPATFDLAPVSLENRRQWMAALPRRPASTVGGGGRRHDHGLRHQRQGPREAGLPRVDRDDGLRASGAPRQGDRQEPLRRDLLGVEVARTCTAPTRRSCSRTRRRSPFTRASASSRPGCSARSDASSTGTGTSSGSSALCHDHDGAGDADRRGSPADDRVLPGEDRASCSRGGRELGPSRRRGRRSSRSRRAQGRGPHGWDDRPLPRRDPASSRAALARALARLVETRTPLHGAADHRVSESLYLADPEGNGLELYRDRPRESWVWHDGLVSMATDPLDVDGLLAEGRRRRRRGGGLPEGTRVGHVHLRVAHIAPAERFYCELIGFDLTTRYGDGASFVATGGYHHHVAFNTWAGVGAPRPPANAAGLKEFVVDLGQAGRSDRAVLRASRGGPRARGNGRPRPRSLRKCRWTGGTMKIRRIGVRSSRFSPRRLTQLRRNDGKALYVAKCAMCHGNDGVGRAAGNRIEELQRSRLQERRHRGPHRDDHSRRPGEDEGARGQDDARSARPRSPPTFSRWRSEATTSAFPSRGCSLRRPSRRRHRRARPAVFLFHLRLQSAVETATTMTSGHLLAPRGEVKRRGPLVRPAGEHRR